MHEHASVGQPARTKIHQPSADTGCSLEDLQGVVEDRDGWHERESENSMLAA